MTKPIELHYWPTPNGHKVSILLEELEVPYTIVPVNIGKGDQFKPEFLKIAPNNRMPAIIDPEPADGGEGISIFESGAIMHYLAEKYGKFLPVEIRKKTEVLQWLNWQMGGLGPMLGQAHHFRTYAPEKIQYGIDRYTSEAGRLYGVMDRRLEEREYLAGEYSIADMASWPWIIHHENQGQDLNTFPNLKKWFETIGERPAVKRALEAPEKNNIQTKPLSEEDKKRLFGHKGDKD